MIIHVRTAHHRCQAQSVAQETEQKHGKQVVFVFMFMFVFVFMFVFMFMFYVYVYVYVCVYVCVKIYVYVCVYVYVCTCIFQSYRYMIKLTVFFSLFCNCSCVRLCFGFFL